MVFERGGVSSFETLLPHSIGQTDNIFLLGNYSLFTVIIIRNPQLQRVDKIQSFDVTERGTCWIITTVL